MKLAYNGVEVTVGENGQFVADIAGARVTAPSYAAMKKKIAAQGAFKRFKIISIGNWNDEMQEGEVTSLGTSKHSRYYGKGKPYFRTTEGEKSAVIEDTPGNRKILQALIKMRAEHRKIEAANTAAFEKLRATISYRRASEES